MAKMWTNLTINGTNFEFNTRDKVTTDKSISRRMIDDCYARPSLAKMHIFNNWQNWFVNNDGYCGVSSYNCNFFSIEGIVFDKETNKEYYCYITPSHNRAWELIEA